MQQVFHFCQVTKSPVFNRRDHPKALAILEGLGHDMYVSESCKREPNVLSRYQMGMAHTLVGRETQAQYMNSWKDVDDT